MLIIPFDWTLSLLDPDYQNYIANSNAIAEYFLERIPLSNCSGQFKFITIKENEDYGKHWDGWRCDASNIYFLGLEHCFTGGAVLKRIYKCAEEYSKTKNENYDFVVGITNENIATFELLTLDCDSNTAGWSDGEGDLPSVIAEKSSIEITTHELGHEFGLDDQYCNCDGVPILNKFCGTYGPKYSKLRTELGCNASGDCCWKESPSPYPLCKWCLGNFDRFGEDTDSDGILDTGDKTAMSSEISFLYDINHFDKYEYIHLQDLPSLQCKTEQLMKLLKMQKLETTLEPTFNLQIMLSIDKNDNINLLELNFTELEPFETESSGEYSLKILDQNNLTSYQKNFSVDFIIFSDPPTITNESIIFEIVNYQENMKKLEIYHNDNLLFSHDIPTFCNNNGICEDNENYISCPSDCKSNALDNLCNREEGDGCDLDCIKGIDPDCNDLLIKILNISTTEPIADDFVFIKTNISNIGTHSFSNMTVEFTLDGKSIENISFSLIANSSLEAIFQWKAQFGIHNLYFSVDNNNLINEINETNNEQKSEINVSGIRIPLYSGWNLLSIPLNLPDKQIKSIFTNNLTIFGYRNNSWFTPTEIDNKLGYWIKVNESKNISIIGAEIPDKTIPLNNDWNLIGYTYLKEKDISELFNNVTVYMYNNSKWYSYDSKKLSYLNTLTKFIPGLGYWLKK